MKYRTSTDIIANIIEAANGGMTKTRIMYNAFLSHKQLKDYLIVLVERDLLDFDPMTQTYRPTQKGMRFIKVYSEMGMALMRKLETREKRFR